MSMDATASLGAGTPARITIDIGDGVHSAPSLDGLYATLIDLARKFKAAHDIVQSAESTQAMMAARLKFGRAIVQLRGQIPSGRWSQLLGEIAHRVQLSTHTVRKAVKIAAALTNERGEIDPAKIRQAKEVLQALKNKRRKLARAEHLGSISDIRTDSDNVARAQQTRNSFGSSRPQEFGAEEYQTESENVARAQQTRDSFGCSADDELDRGFDEPIGPISWRGLDEYASALSPAFELPVIDVDMPAAKAAGAAGSQLTFASLWDSAEKAVALVVESAAKADRSAARAIASTLRAAADRIEASAGEPAVGEDGEDGGVL